MFLFGRKKEPPKVCPLAPNSPSKLLSRGCCPKAWVQANARAVSPPPLAAVNDRKPPEDEGPHGHNGEAHSVCDPGARC
jgi:hypothetical protein